MSFPVGLIMVLASTWIAYLGSSYPRRALARRICGSSAAFWGGYVSAILCLVYSAGMALSDLLAFGGVSFWLGLNLVYSTCFWVVPAAVVVSAATKALAQRGKVDAAFTRPTWLEKGATAVSLLLLGMGLYASLYEPNAVRLNTVHLTSAKLTSSDRMKIVHLSDLHITRLGIRERHALRLIKSASPDIILLTGDFLGRPTAAAQVQKFVSQLRAKEGVFAVPSDGDARNNVFNLLEGTGVRLLQNEGLSIEPRGLRAHTTRQGTVVGSGVHPALPPVRIVGLREEKPNARRALAGANAEEFTVVMSHSPWTLHSVPSADLFLAGQNHGGQIGVSPLRESFISHLGGDPAYPGGLYREGNLTMYVSRGVGMEGNDAPRIRFLARPEVTLIVVRGEGTAVSQ